VAGAVLGVAALAYSPVVGFAWDDGVYVASGQALARGDGYVLANRVGYQTVPSFAPGYPLLASVVWLVLGSARATLLALSALGASCAAAAAYLWWRIARREHGPAVGALLVGIPALSYASLRVATLRMSDAPYALIVVAATTLWGAEDSSRLLSTRRLLALVAIAAAAAPLRSAGAVLPVAVFLLLLARRRWAWAAGLACAAIAVQLAIGALLRQPQPSYAELTRAAWADGGAWWPVFAATWGGHVWEALGSLVAPPLLYSGAVHELMTSLGAVRVAYVVALVAIGGAVLCGGWLRLREGLWHPGDLALLGALALPFVAPLGMDPRFLVPYGPVVALWAFAALRRGADLMSPRPGRLLRRATLALLTLMLAGTAAQAVRFVRGAPPAAAARAAAYLRAAGAARTWLGRGGLVVAEFPETLWLMGGERAISTTSPLENVLVPDAAVDEVRHRVGAVAHGCLLDTRTFPTSRIVFEEMAARPGAVTLPAADALLVRVVCWRGAGTPDATPTPPRLAAPLRGE